MCQKVKGLMGIICQASKIASQETKKNPTEKLKTAVLKSREPPSFCIKLKSQIAENPYGI